MSILHPARGGDPVALAATLRALADDIERISMFQPREELVDAPVLDDWKLTRRPAPALTGSVMSHPVLGSQSPIVTSELFAFSRRGKWARTLNRFYVLGRPAAQSEAK